jgi:hypothetical protein
LGTITFWVNVGKNQIFETIVADQTDSTHTVGLDDYRFHGFPFVHEIIVVIQ